MKKIYNLILIEICLDTEVRKICNIQKMKIKKYKQVVKWHFLKRLKKWMILNPFKIFIIRLELTVYHNNALITKWAVDNRLNEHILLIAQWTIMGLWVVMALMVFKISNLISRRCHNDSVETLKYIPSASPIHKQRTT